MKKPKLIKTIRKLVSQGYITDCSRATRLIENIQNNIDPSTCLGVHLPHIAWQNPAEQIPHVLETMRAMGTNWFVDVLTKLIKLRKPEFKYYFLHATPIDQDFLAQICDYRSAWSNNFEEGSQMLIDSGLFLEDYHRQLCELDNTVQVWWDGLNPEYKIEEDVEAETFELDKYVEMYKEKHQHTSPIQLTKEFFNVYPILYRYWETDIIYECHEDEEIEEMDEYGKMYGPSHGGVIYQLEYNMSDLLLMTFCGNDSDYYGKSTKKTWPIDDIMDAFHMAHENYEYKHKSDDCWVCEEEGKSCITRVFTELAEKGWTEFRAHGHYSELISIERFPMFPPYYIKYTLGLYQANSELYKDGDPEIINWYEFVNKLPGYAKIVVCEMAKF